MAPLPDKCGLPCGAPSSCMACNEGGLYVCRKKEEEEIDPEQARKDMERLELIKQRRYISTLTMLPTL